MGKTVYRLLGSAAIIGMLGMAGIALADSVAINFESYSLGTINGQDGWSSLGAAGSGCAMYDHAVSTPGIASTKALRISNAVTSGCFGDQTFSKSLTNDAGEATAQASPLSGGTRQSHFEAQFDLASVVPGAQQPGLVMSTSPDRGDGARMSYLRFEDQGDGTHVFFDDYQDVVPKGTLATPADGCGAGDDFVETEIAVLDRSVKHTVKFTVDFVAGPGNDVVKIYIDSVLQHTGTTWEDYFRWCTESGGGVPNNALADVSRAVDSLLFRTGGVAAPATLGNGFLIDNLSLISGPVLVGPPTNKDQCKNDGWKTFNNPKFKNQGDCVSFVATGGKNPGAGN